MNGRTRVPLGGLRTERDTRVRADRGMRRSN